MFIVTFDEARRAYDKLILKYAHVFEKVINNSLYSYQDLHQEGLLKVHELVIRVYNDKRDFEKILKTSIVNHFLSLKTFCNCKKRKGKILTKENIDEDNFVVKIFSVTIEKRKSIERMERAYARIILREALDILSRTRPQTYKIAFRLVYSVLFSDDRMEVEHKNRSIRTVIADVRKQLGMHTRTFKKHLEHIREACLQASRRIEKELLPI